MVHRAVDVVHGAVQAAQHRFAIQMRLARLRLTHGAGHIELVAMIRRIITCVTATVLAISIPSAAYAGVKLTLSYITKWEVIGSWKVVGYVGETPFVFVDFSFSCPSLNVGGNFVLRTFSPSIQAYDTVIVNGKTCMVDSVEGIRQN